MAHTEITLTSNSGVLVPSQTSVRVVSGDTIAFSIADGSNAVAFFSPGLIAVLSPTPASGQQRIGAEQTVFTFTTSEPGAYGMFFEASADSKHPRFPVRESSSLLLGIDAEGATFSGPTNTTNTAGFTGSEAVHLQAGAASVHAPKAHSMEARANFSGPVNSPNTAGKTDE